MRERGIHKAQLFPLFLDRCLRLVDEVTPLVLLMQLQAASWNLPQM